MNNNLKNSPASSKDLVLWWCIFISLLPAGYSFYLLSFYDVLLLLIKMLIVFILVFILIECYDHPTSTWNFHHWWNKPLYIKALRCFVALPIYNGTFSVLIWLFEFCSFKCSIESSVISLLLAFPFAYVIFKSVLKFAVLKEIPTRGQLITCAFGYYWLLNAKVMLIKVPDGTPRPLSYTKFVNGEFQLIKCVNGKMPNRDKPTIGQRAWELFHEAPRQKWDEKLKEIESGAHQQHAHRGGDSVVNANWEALGYKTSHDCLRIVCKASQAIIKNLQSKSPRSPESPSSSEFNPFK